MPVFLTSCRLKCSPLRKRELCFRRRFTLHMVVTHLKNRIAIQPVRTCGITQSSSIVEILISRRSASITCYDEPIPGALATHPSVDNQQVHIVRRGLAAHSLDEAHEVTPVRPVVFFFQVTF